MNPREGAGALRAFAPLPALLSLQLLGSVPTARQEPTPEVAAPPSPIRVAVDPRVELMSILMRVLGAPEYNMSNAGSPYADDVDEWFGPLGEHAVFQTLRELRRERGISFDAPMSLAMHLTDVETLDELVSFDPRPARLDERWPLERTRAFLVELRDFVEYSSFGEFLSEHAALYDESARRLEEVVARHSFVPWLRAFFGVDPSATFTVVPGLLNGGGNYGSGAIFADGSESITPIIGAGRWDEDGLPVFGDAQVPTIVHEFVHSYTNRLVDENRPTLEPCGDVLYERDPAIMDRQAYGSGLTVMYESLVRASVLRYLAATEGEPAAGRQAAGDVERGFAWVPGLAEVLARYEATRDAYPDLGTYMGEVASFFRAEVGP